MTTSKLALPEKRADLLRQRDHLREQLAQIEDKIRAVDLIMNDRQFLAYVLSESGPPASQVDASGNGSVPSVGVRSAIRAVLGRTPQSMKPIEVTKLLHQEGYDAASDHDIGWLKLRVSQEMHRMMKAGKLKRSSTGRYKLAETETGSEG